MEAIHFPHARSSFPVRPGNTSKSLNVERLTSNWPKLAPERPKRIAWRTMNGKTLHWKHGHKVFPLRTEPPCFKN